MSREILFRGRGINSMEWAEGYLFTTRERIYIAYPDQYDDDLFNYTDCIFSTVDRKTVCQYIGLVDKNGRKIFENDIIQIDSEEDESFIVKWDNDNAQIIIEGETTEADFKSYWSNEVEVIGNIFDNPEMIQWRSHNDGE